MPKISKLIFSFTILTFLLIPVFCFANSADEIFKAEVIEILEEKEIIAENNSSIIQQNIKLKGLEGEWQDKEIVFQGIDEFEVVKNSQYKTGDHVLVSSSNGKYYIIDFVRNRILYWLAGIFIILVAAIGRFKGMRALLGLLASFLVIMKIIIPKILAGSSPLFISILGSVLILFIVIYLTEGINRKSNLAIITVFFSLIIVGVFSTIFSNLAKLTGFSGEETMFLIGFGMAEINFKGMLLAGIIIGTLGVLDDAVISQIASVEQIKNLDQNLSKREIYKRAMKIGVSHMSSMINTLFLVYAGAFLPLLILFTIKEPPFATFNQIINNEMIATEIIRTLTGSIGLILSIPLATFLAVYFLKNK